jgi:hypothetical protein
MKEVHVRVAIEPENERDCLFRLSSLNFNRSADADIEPKHRFLVRLEAAYESAMRAMEGAERGLLLWIKKLIGYLSSKIDADEALMKALHKADIVEVLYPAMCKEKWVRRLFRRFIRRQTRHHRRWLIVNLLLLPVTGAMMIVPGPNVFFGWNAYRFISHYLAHEGGKRVRRGISEVRFVEDELCPLSVVSSPSLQGRGDSD